jgi:hypothetical protein
VVDRVKGDVIVMNLGGVALLKRGLFCLDRVAGAPDGGCLEHGGGVLDTGDGEAPVYR